jgi:hypothetical protein
MAHMESTLSIQTSPRKLIRDLTMDERDRSPVLLDLIAKLIDQQTICCQLTVSFQPIRVGRGILNRSDYYVGTTGIEVSIRAVKGEIVGYTQPSTIDVVYSRTDGNENGRGEKISPEVKLKSGVEVKIGALESNKKRTQSETVTFSSAEMILVATELADMVRWNIDTHRAEKAIRDYLVGNTFLEATFKWNGGDRTGEIKLRPEIRFFDNDKRLLSRKASIRMRFVMFTKGIRLANERGFDLSFSEGA